jgi:hypothetical protein
VERARDEVQPVQGSGVHIARPVGEYIHLDRSEHAEAVTLSGELGVQPVDPVSLQDEPVLVHPIRDPQALGVIL